MADKGDLGVFNRGSSGPLLNTTKDNSIRYDTTEPYKPPVAVVDTKQNRSIEHKLQSTVIKRLANEAFGVEVWNLPPTTVDPNSDVEDVTSEEQAVADVILRQTPKQVMTAAVTELSRPIANPAKVTEWLNTLKAIVYNRARDRGISDEQVFPGPDSPWRQKTEKIMAEYGVNLNPPPKVEAPRVFSTKVTNK